MNQADAILLIEENYQTLIEDNFTTLNSVASFTEDSVGYDCMSFKVDLDIITTENFMSHFGFGLRIFKVDHMNLNGKTRKRIKFDSIPYTELVGKDLKFQVMYKIDK